MMKKNILFFINSIWIIFFCGCKDHLSDPQIIFKNGLDSITDVFPGEEFVIDGEIISDKPISGAFCFHQQKDSTGKIEESGGRLDIDLNGSSKASFTQNIVVKNYSTGVKFIVEDTKGNRTVKIYKIIQGIDNLNISFDGEGYIESIKSGEPFNIKGVVNSETKLTRLTYQIIIGDIIEDKIDIEIAKEKSVEFNIPLIAKNGMTGILINAENEGELIVSKLFEIKNVESVGPVIHFDDELINVKPDSLFYVTGSISSNYDIKSAVYSVVRGENTDEPNSLLLTNNKFNLEVNAGNDVTSVIISVLDTKDNETNVAIPVNILFPEAVIGDVMIHYKNIILTDERFPKSYFSFSLKPYVLNESIARDNQNEVNLIYTNCFIAEEHKNNGPAIFGPNVSTGSTIKAHDLVNDWSTPYNLTRLPVASDFCSKVGKTFDEIGDTNEEWNIIDEYIKNKIANSSVVRQYNMSVGYMFAIGYGGKKVEDINKYAIAIVRGIGGEKATSPEQSTGAWLELEIKTRK